MSDQRIVYTRHDGGVSVCCPSDEAIAWMGCGGFWGQPPRGFLAEQLRRNVAAGRNEAASWRLIQAMQFGGCTTAEALAIIRDRDCSHLGTCIEVWDVDDVPSDRWFRDAWRRSHNGGPISIDMRKARRIQWERVKTSVEAHNKPRLALGRKPYIPAWGEIGNAIRHAKDEHELRRVWPRLAMTQCQSAPFDAGMV